MLESRYTKIQHIFFSLESFSQCSPPPPDVNDRTKFQALSKPRLNKGLGAIVID